MKSSMIPSAKKVEHARELLSRYFQAPLMVAAAVCLVAEKYHE
jgi:hypothetical protein